MIKHTSYSDFEQDLARIQVLQDKAVAVHDITGMEKLLAMKVYIIQFNDSLPSISPLMQVGKVLRFQATTKPEESA